MSVYFSFIYCKQLSLVDHARRNQLLFPGTAQVVHQLARPQICAATGRRVPHFAGRTVELLKQVVKVHHDFFPGTIAAGYQCQQPAHCDGAGIRINPLVFDHRGHAADVPIRDTSQNAAQTLGHG